MCIISMLYICAVLRLLLSHRSRTSWSQKWWRRLSCWHNKSCWNRKVKEHLDCGLSLKLGSHQPTDWPASRLLLIIQNTFILTWCYTQIFVCNKCIFRTSKCGLKYCIHKIFPCLKRFKYAKSIINFTDGSYPNTPGVLCLWKKTTFNVHPNAPSCTIKP